MRRVSTRVLPEPGARDHEQRRAVVGHRGALRLVEPVEQLLGRRPLRGGPAAGRERRRRRPAHLAWRGPVGSGRTRSCCDHPTARDGHDRAPPEAETLPQVQRFRGPRPRGLGHLNHRRKVDPVEGLGHLDQRDAAGAGASSAAVGGEVHEVGDRPEVATPRPPDGGERTRHDTAPQDHAGPVPRPVEVGAGELGQHQVGAVSTRR